MIWLIFAVLTGLVILALTRPLGERKVRVDSAPSNAELYRIQLAALDREEERATIGPEEAAQTRAEIARRLIKAGRSRALPNSSGDPVFVKSNAAFAATALLISVGALALYIAFGSPSLPDQPLEARLSAPPDQQPLDIQIANVERRLRAHPEDGLGWTVIAPVYFRIGQFEKAADAFRKAIALNGENEDKLLGLAESLTFANDGVVTEPARKAFMAAVARNPKSLRGRFWLAILAEQDGAKADAEQIYRQLLSEALPEAFRSAVNGRLQALANPPVAEARGADKSDDSAGLLQGEQGATIRGMVERLAERLKQDKSDLDGWLRLIRSYAVLKETEKAQQAAASARKQFAADPQALAQIDTLTRGLGLASPDAEGSQPRS